MPNPHHWAVVVGIDQYPAFQSLRCAKRDAQAFADWLAHPGGGGLPPAQIKKVLVDLPTDAGVQDAQPTKERIFREIEACFTAADNAVKAQPGIWKTTRLYLYFSGHGIARDAADACLLAANSDATHLGEHVSCQILQDFFRHQRYFRDLVAFADCCRDNKAGQVTPPSLPWTLGAQVGGDATCLFMAYATDFGFKAYEEQAGPIEERRGYFTRCLLETLHNRMDGKPRLEADVLKKRLKGLLAEISSQPGAPPAGLRIEPVCINEDEIAFGITGDAPEYLVELEAAATIRSVRLREQEGAPWRGPFVRPATGDWHIRLPLGMYDLEYASTGSPAFATSQEPLKVLPGFNRKVVGP
jgi:hypothetical protein